MRRVKLAKVLSALMALLMVIGTCSVVAYAENLGTGLQTDTGKSSSGSISDVQQILSELTYSEYLSVNAGALNANETVTVPATDYYADATTADVKIESGIGGLSVTFGKVTITAIATALILGIIVNLVLHRESKAK